MQETDGLKFVSGVWLPKQEKHLVDWMLRGKRAYTHKGRVTYQWQKQDLAMGLAREHGHLRGVMVDVGAHCGLWAMWWAELVEHVVAYEPVPLHRDALHLNMGLVNATNYEVVPLALGQAAGRVELRLDPENTGHTRAYGPAEARIQSLTVEVTTLDADLPDRLMPGQNVGVVKIDCEGYEENVVMGARWVLETHRPLVVVEQKQEHLLGFERHGAVKALKAMGYRVAKEMSGDFFMVPA